MLNEVGKVDAEVLLANNVPKMTEGHFDDEKEDTTLTLKQWSEKEREGKLIVYVGLVRMLKEHMREECIGNYPMDSQ